MVNVGSNNSHSLALPQPYGKLKPFGLASYLSYGLQEHCVATKGNFSCFRAAAT